MVKWNEVLDLTQPENRRKPFLSGSISDRTTVNIQEALNKKRRKAPSEVRTAFDILVNRMSRVFPSWKGVKCDFRFVNHEGTVVFTLSPEKTLLGVRIRIDATGYRNRKKLFPKTVSAGSKYPGDWVWANVKTEAEAIAIADDVEKELAGKR